MTSAISYEEMVQMSQEAVFNSLISGKDFAGLGSVAKHVVMYVAHVANAHAVAKYGDKTARTSEAFAEMEKACQKQFVLDVLGWGNEADDIRGAVARLVNRVWTAYDNWAYVASIEA